MYCKMWFCHWLSNRRLWIAHAILQHPTLNPLTCKMRQHAGQVIAANSSENNTEKNTSLSRCPPLFSKQTGNTKASAKYYTDQLAVLHVQVLSAVLQSRGVLSTTSTSTTGEAAIASPPPATPACTALLTSTCGWPDAPVLLGTSSMRCSMSGAAAALVFPLRPPSLPFLLLLLLLLNLLLMPDAFCCADGASFIAAGLRSAAGVNDGAAAVLSGGPVRTAPANEDCSAGFAACQYARKFIHCLKCDGKFAMSGSVKFDPWAL